MIQLSSRSRIAAISLLAAVLAVSPALAANADTTIDGPIDLGTASTYSVLGASTVTNTGPSVLNGDLGLSPGTSITGFAPPGVVNGTINQTNALAAQAQSDLTTAYNTAASLTPMETGIIDLAGRALVPGVYSGGEMSLTGALILNGTAESVWVFQAASTLTVGSGASITFGPDGASACNVFWQVGSSATLGTGAQFAGTVMADVSVTANTSATIVGRLMARTGAVTLDTNTITAPTGCTTATGTVRTSPTITSAAPPSGEVGSDYSHTITASGTSGLTYTVSSGSLPTGTVLDSTTGVISGQPTAAGTYTYTITVSNGTGPDATATYTVIIAAALASSGVDVGAAPLIAATLLCLGLCLVFTSRHLASRRTRA